MVVSEVISLVDLPAPVLKGARLTLRPFGPEQVHDRYLAWLSDPMVNAHSQRLGAPPVDANQARAYLSSLGRDEVVLGIHIEPEGHVGNIKYGPIDYTNRRADVSILIGEPTVWGRGIGAEAIHLVCKFLFEVHDLNRVEAGSSNPAFLKIVADLGWQVEGVLRQRVMFPDGFRDHTLVALLREDFRRRPKFERPES